MKRALFALTLLGLAACADVPSSPVPTQQVATVGKPSAYAFESPPCGQNGSYGRNGCWYFDTYIQGSWEQGNNITESCIWIILHDGWYACLEEFGPPNNSQATMGCDQYADHSRIICHHWIV